MTRQRDHALPNMAATHYGLVLFFSDYPKAIRRGEIALKSNHLVKFRFDNNTGQFLGVVQASQRNKNYKVEVNMKHFFVLFRGDNLPVCFPMRACLPNSATIFRFHQRVKKYYGFKCSPSISILMILVTSRQNACNFELVNISHSCRSINAMQCQ